MLQADGSAPAGHGHDPSARPRERILETAYDLFAHHGVRAIGVDRIAAEAGVAKMSLYRHYSSKESLVLAVLALRRERWTLGWLRAAVDRLSSSPERRPLAVFDALDEWFRSDDYEGCMFTNTLLEMHDAADPAHAQSVDELELIRLMLETDASDAGVLEPEAAGYQLQILMLGAIVSAARGNLDAGLRARELAELLLLQSPRKEQHRPDAGPPAQ
jgi:AcrR family transcriptional regulator